MIGYAKKIEKIIRESAFDKKKKKPGLKFKPGLALIRVGTTGPSTLKPKMCDPIIVNPVVKMLPHPAAHPH